MDEEMQLYERMLDSTCDAVFAATPDGTITYWNSAACRMFGWRRDEVLGRKFYETCLSGFSPDQIGVIMARLARSEAWSGELLARCRTGETFPVLAHYSPMAEEGKPIGIIGVSHDITNIKQAENQLIKRRDELESQVEERTRELAELAHRLVNLQEEERIHIARELHDDVGQQLTYLKLLLEQSCRTADPAALEEAKLLADEVLRSVRNLSSMLIHPVLDTDGLVSALESMFSQCAQHTGIQVDFQHSGALDRIPSDAALGLYRIAQEALTNIIRHARALEATVRLNESQGYLLLEVRDQGVGFDPEHVAHSVGLTSMKERARVVGGKLRVVSVEGRGTTVSCIIPARPADITDKSGPQPPLTSGTN